jgi:hypothetical protein
MDAACREAPVKQTAAKSKVTADRVIDDFFIRFI